MADEARPLAALRAMPPPRPTGQRRDWLARAVFEGALISLSLVGALALNEWQDSRNRQARVRDALAAMRLELQANRSEIERVIARNTEVAEKIKEATANGRRYEDGILRRAQVVSTAFDSARAAAITNDVPFATLMVLGRAYSLQADYQREIGSFYDSLLAGSLGDIRGQPRLLLGLLHDLDDNARKLAREYDTALAALATR